MWSSNRDPWVVVKFGSEPFGIRVSMRGLTDLKDMVDAIQKHHLMTSDVTPAPPVVASSARFQRTEPESSDQVCKALARTQNSSLPKK